MTDLDKLLRQYIERFEAGGNVDPNELLSQAHAGEREELRELIAATSSTPPLGRIGTRRRSKDRSRRRRSTV